MKIINDDETIKLKEQHGIGLGNFDGIHIAHEKLISTLVNECKKREIQSMIYTFFDHPLNVLKHRQIKLISTLEKKKSILDNLNVDVLCLKHFDEQFANIEAKHFIINILVKKYNVKLIIVGFNYHFGKQGLGDTKLLKELGMKYNYEVIVLPPIYYKKEMVSSSNIREKILEGDMIKVKSLLGKNYTIKGKVEYGNRIGTLIGFPTANIIPLKDYALPKYGVYYTKTIVDGITYNSITNLGYKPTINDKKDIIIETHIFDFSDWLYGKEIEVIFIKNIRDEKKYENIQQLKNQILKDIKVVKKYVEEENG